MIDHMIWLGIVWKGAGGSLMLNVPPLKHGGSSPIKQQAKQKKQKREKRTVKAIQNCQNVRRIWV